MIIKFSTLLMDSWTPKQGLAGLLRLWDIMWHWEWNRADSSYRNPKGNCAIKLSNLNSIYKKISLFIACALGGGAALHFSYGNQLSREGETIMMGDGGGEIKKKMACVRAKHRKRGRKIRSSSTQCRQWNNFSHYIHFVLLFSSSLALCFTPKNAELLPLLPPPPLALPK